MHDRVARLSEAQKQCLRLAGEGLSSKEIAPKLNLSHQTVDQYLHRARLVLGAENRREAARKFKAAEGGEVFKKLELKPEPVAEAPETVILEEPVSGSSLPKRWFGLPPEGGWTNELTATQRLVAVAKIALVVISWATAIMIIVRGALIVLSSAS